MFGGRGCLIYRREESLLNTPARSLRRLHMIFDPGLQGGEVTSQIQMSGGREMPGEETARAKALSRVCTCPIARSPEDQSPV